MQSNNINREPADVPHNRSGYGSDCSNLSLPVVKKSLLAGVHSPRSQRSPWPSKILESPKSIVVSATGERIIIPSEDVPKMYTNPFAIEDQRIENLDSTSEVSLQQFSPKKQKYPNGKKRRRAGEVKERRRLSKFVLKQRNSAGAHNQRCIKTQSDISMYNIKASPECIGDGEIHYCYDLGNSFVDKSSRKFVRFPETVKTLLSFILMIVLIFLTISELLNINRVTDIFNTAIKYVRSFRLDYYVRKPPTMSERILKYLTYIFE